MSETPADEARRARASVGFHDDGGRSVLLRVTGADRVPFLHRLLTCDIMGVAEGGTVAGLLLTPKGRVLADLLLAVGPGRVDVVAPAAAGGALRGGLAKYAVADDVAIEDRAGAARLLSFVGPRAEAASEVFLDRSAEGASAWKSVLAMRSARAGLPAVDLVVEGAGEAALVGEALSAATALGGGALGDAALEALRVEAGEPALGAEATEDTLPPECGLDGLVSYTKGCFVGQEPLARLKTRGHTNRGLAGLLLGPGARIPARGDAVLDGEEECGAVTSAVESPSLGRPIALALLRHGHATPGTQLSIRTAGGPVPCEAAAMPFVR